MRPSLCTAVLANSCMLARIIFCIYFRFSLFRIQLHNRKAAASSTTTWLRKGVLAILTQPPLDNVCSQHHVHTYDYDSPRYKCCSNGITHFTTLLHCWWTAAWFQWYSGLQCICTLVQTHLPHIAVHCLYMGVIMHHTIMSYAPHPLYCPNLSNVKCWDTVVNNLVRGCVG